MTDLFNDKPATEALIQRIRSFDQNAIFDGYPTMTCADEGLIEAACVENEMPDWARLVAFLAAEYIETPEELRNARRFYDEMTETIWQANMIEGSNSAYEALLNENAA